MKEFSEEVKELAKVLHSLNCNANHTDGCLWFYGEAGRYYHYEEAEKLFLQFQSLGISIEQLKNLSLLLHPTRKDWLD